MSRILYTDPPQFPLWKELPFVITTVRSQTYVSGTTALTYTIPANTPLLTITVDFPANFNLNQDTVILSTLLDPAVDYQGVQPVGINSWIGGNADNQADVQCYNFGGADVDFKVSAMIF